MNTAAKGRRLERKTQDYFEARGYITMTSRASKGVFDVHAWNSQEGVYIQVKANRPPPIREMILLQLTEVPAGSRKLIHIWKDGARSPIEEEL